MHAYLIVGGNKETRAKKLGEILGQRERFNLKNPDWAPRYARDDSSLKIEEVREAEEWVSRKRNRVAVLVVEEADRLTLPAQHAFLKTLEEPGDNILIVLTAADGLSLLATIRSRCKIIRLPAAAIEAADGEKFRKLLTGSAAERLVSLYPILKEITGSGASLHRGTVKRDEAIMFIESVIPALSPLRPRSEASRNLSRIKSGTGYRFPVKSGMTAGMTLEAAATAHRRLKNNLNPTLTLHQFILDIPPD